jgi:hypothetical protein
MTYVGVSKEWIKNNAACLVGHISTPELLDELKRRYSNEPATLDYIEMIEAEVQYSWVRRQSE